MDETLSDEGAKSLQKQFEAYWLSLGRFVHEFAEIERAFKTLLWDQAGVPDTVGMAVFSGVKADAAAGLIKRIAATRGDDPNFHLLERAFAQFGEINRTRNEILHFGITEFIDGQMIVTNVISAHVPEILRKITVGPQLLEDMTNDLGSIRAHFGLYRFLTEKRPGIPVWQGIEQIPWRYKPPSQAANRKARQPRQGMRQAPSGPPKP